MHTEITPAQVLDELAEIAFAEFGGEVKISDKLKALELLYRHFHMGEGTGDEGVVILDDVAERE